MDNTINIKLAVLGEGEVGKTSIINSFIGEEIPERYMPTIGTITHRKDYRIKEKDKVVIITLWDGGGQKSFNPFNPALYRDVDGALLVFDLTKPKETLKNLKKEFLENANRHSEEVLTLYVGNKLDQLLDEKGVKTILKDYMTKKDNLFLVSAKTGEGIKECIELMIFTFLRKAEIIDPEFVPDDTAKEFLNLIGTNEKKLRAGLINLNNIETAFRKVKPKTKHKKDNVIEKEDQDLKYLKFLKGQLQTNENQKNDVFDQFLICITELDKAVNHVKKTRMKSVNDLVENLEDLLLISKKDFEKNMERIKKLNAEEFELIKIILKTKEDQSKSIKTTDQEEKIEIKKQEFTNNSYKRYEEENPGKKALWRGKETKDFIAWKKKNGPIMKISN